MEALRIIYLDFDGMLMHPDVRISRKQGVYMAAPGHLLFECAPVMAIILVNQLGTQQEF